MNELHKEWCDKNNIEFCYSCSNTGWVAVHPEAPMKLCPRCYPNGIVEASEKK